jgi:hypothetical protein
MIKYIEGDMFGDLKNIPENEMVFLPHVCNDQKAWGQGFVGPLGKNYPVAKNNYLNSKSIVLGHTQFIPVSNNIIVCNMVAQTLGGVRPLYYNHLVVCMERVAETIHTFNWDEKKRIIAPAFGSNLAGGDWNFITELINDCWIDRGIDVTIYYLPGTLTLEKK